ncbi:MAG: hypothetical protein ABI640_12485 [Gammaproteobacteria bacterium]
MRISRVLQKTLTHPGILKPSLFLALPIAAMCALPIPAMADPPIWAVASRVKATHTQCGELQSILFKGDSFKGPAAPNPPGCTSVEVIYFQLNVFKPFFGADNRGFAEANVDAGYIACGENAAADGKRGVLIIGTPAEIERARRQHPEPQGCTFTRQKFQYVSSAGSIAFTDVPNGGTMSIQESLALHAKERERAIAECNASPACQAEVSRRSAINAYYDCMKPLQPNEPDRTCRRPW